MILLSELNVNSDVDVTTADINMKKYNYLTGTIGALVGAFIGAIPWAMAYHFGWFVGWLGFLIGVCVIKGYSKMRGKKGWPAVFIIVFAIVFGVIAGQVLGDFLGIAKYIANGEIAWATYSDIPEIYIYVLRQDSGALSYTIGNLALGFLFAGLGVWRIIKSMISDLRSKKQDDVNPIKTGDLPIAESNNDLAN